MTEVCYAHPGTHHTDAVYLESFPRLRLLTKIMCPEIANWKKAILKVLMKVKQ